MGDCDRRPLVDCTTVVHHESPKLSIDDLSSITPLKSIEISTVLRHLVSVGCTAPRKSRASWNFDSAARLVNVVCTAHSQSSTRWHRRGRASRRWRRWRGRRWREVGPTIDYWLSMIVLFVEESWKNWITSSLSDLSSWWNTTEPCSECLRKAWLSIDYTSFLLIIYTLLFQIDIA